MQVLPDEEEGCGGTAAAGAAAGGGAGSAGLPHTARVQRQQLQEAAEDLTSQAPWPASCLADLQDGMGSSHWGRQVRGGGPALSLTTLGCPPSLDHSR